MTYKVPASDFASRKPLVDYAGVTPSLLKEFGTGAPFPYNDLAYQGREDAIDLTRFSCRSE